MVQLINAGTRDNYYKDGNKPFWFPEDKPFVAPTNKKSYTYTSLLLTKTICMVAGTIQGKFSVVELREIFQAFLDSCPESYVMYVATLYSLTVLHHLFFFFLPIK